MPRGDRVKQAAEAVAEVTKPTPAKQASPRSRTKQAAEAVAEVTKSTPAKQAAPKSRTKQAASIEPQAPAAPSRRVIRLLEKYRQEVASALGKEFGYKNPMQIPRLQKVVLNVGLSEALTNQKAVESTLKDITSIAGQHPVVTRARKSIAAFKLRAGMPIGVMTTLRGHRMYDFLDKLVNVALPRIRDFRGVPRSGTDGRGNYSLGLREQVIFPEIDYNQIDRLRGLQITIVTTAKTGEECLRLLELLGMPFVRAAGAVAKTA